MTLFLKGEKLMGAAGKALPPSSGTGGAPSWLEEKLKGDAGTKGKNSPVQGILLTDKAVVHLEGPVDRKFLERLNFSEGLNNFRPCQQQKKALENIAGDPDGMVFIALCVDTVIGYITFHDPDFPWWKDTGIKELVELGGLEIAPEWRNCGIASGMLKAIFSNEAYDYLEGKIVMNVQTVYCWDMRNSNLSPWQYRNLMKSMLEKFDFVVENTDDPEIREHPANMLMVRYGKKVKKESIARFLYACKSRSRFF